MEFLNAVNRVLRPVDLRLIRHSSAEAMLLMRSFAPSHADTPLPDGAEAYLRSDNARLRWLRDRYAMFESPVTVRSGWSQRLLNTDLILRYFRGDSVYVWQYRDGNRDLSYIVTAQYLMGHDPLRLFDVLSEDGAFGVYSFEAPGGIVVSRDLLDSIAELYFLEREIALSTWVGARMLDIGAGYGRLPHRTLTAFPGVTQYYCADVIPESTFLCEYYLRYRGMEDRARVLLVDEIQTVVADAHIDVATSISSLVEAPIAATRWWLSLLRDARVKYLMMVPSPTSAVNRDGLYSMETDGTRKDLRPELEYHGYRPVAVAPKYTDPIIQKVGVSPTTHYLFALSE